MLLDWGVRATEWLLTHDSPAVRARARHWLLELPWDHPAVQAEVRLFPDDPGLRALLAGQAADGSWHGPALYCPKHRATFWVLGALAEMGAGRWLPGVERAAEFALRFQAKNGEVYQLRRAEGGAPSAQRPVPCVTARLMSWLAQLGYARDPRLTQAVDHLLSTQRPDGGWSCEGRAMPRDLETERPCLGVAGSFLGLAEAVPGLAEHEATRRAVDLVASLYFKDPKGFHVGNTWRKLLYPCFFMDLGGTGRLLLALSGGRPLFREVVAPGVEYLLSRRTVEGLWPTDGSPYRPPVDPGRRGKPHPWVTLRVLRFLKAAGAWPAGNQLPPRY
jgi:hypothetical protein